MQPCRTIISGGQTGVDRAALDVALQLGIACGGWCPAGRSAEDGRIPDRYPLAETPAADPAQRTARNVRESDGTLILADMPLAGGTEYSAEVAQRLGKPLLIVPPDAGQAPDVAAWLANRTIRILNIAGPRESEVPGVYARVANFLRTLFGA